MVARYLVDPDQSLLLTHLTVLHLPHVWCDFWQAEQALLAFFLRGLEPSIGSVVGTFVPIGS
jgi:hypothetical protein